MQQRTDELVANVPRVLPAADYVSLATLVSQLVDIARALAVTQDDARRRHIIDCCNGLSKTVLRFVHASKSGKNVDEAMRLLNITVGNLQDSVCVFLVLFFC